MSSEAINYAHIDSSEHNPSNHIELSSRSDIDIEESAEVEEESLHHNTNQFLNQTYIQKFITSTDRINCCNTKGYRRATLVTFWFIACVWVLLLFSVLYFYFTIHTNDVYQAMDPEPDYSKYNKVIDITLLGDSLINVPYSYFNLASKIRSRIIVDSDTGVRFHNAGVNGQAIAKIRGRVDSVLELNSSGLILFWDSDMDHLDESKLTQDEINAYRSTYINDIRYIIESSRRHGTDVITIAGPGLYAEGPYYVPLEDRAKNSMLDTYRSINQGVCAEYSIPYSDIRESFLKAIPELWPYSMGYVTLDGEHPNNRGTELLADLFATHINQWIKDK